ncbi:hypothetical protein GCK32_010445 [Trichostrongylus colubriformis]|uniref:Uncharacterized protein n=1 Tax=Trichostrongylus colubriformis TaxID=6319 RepID=A0AAN8G0H2_TRICO
MAAQDNSRPSDYEEHDDSKEPEERVAGAGNLSVYYGFGDGYRDMFVAIGLMLESILVIAIGGMEGYVGLLMLIINIGFKIVVCVVAYAAAAQRNGKLMIFVAILSGIASAVTIYYDIVAFSTFSHHNFSMKVLPYTIQAVLDLIIYLHMIYYSIVLL